MYTTLTILALTLSSNLQTGLCDLVESVVCTPPLTACYNGGLPIVCKNLQSDPANCGACGNVCATGLQCYNSQCQAFSTSGGNSGGSGGASWDAGVILQNPNDLPGQSWAHPIFAVLDAGGGGGGGSSWDAGVLIEQQPIQVIVDGGALGATVTNKVSVVDQYLADGGDINAVITNVVSVVDQYLADGGNTNTTVTNKVSVVDQYLADGGSINAVVTNKVSVVDQYLADGGNVNTNTTQSGVWSVLVQTDGGTVETTPVGTCVGTSTTVAVNSTKVPATNQTGRRTILIQNEGSSNIYCSESQGANDAGGGFLLLPNAAVTIDSSANVQWYCVGSASTVTWSEECAN